MMTRRQKKCWWTPVLLLAGLPAPAGAANAAPAAASRPGFVLPDDAHIGATPQQIARAIALPPAPEAWTPAVQKSRGPALALYPHVAPATVIVHTPVGHGTGIVVDPQGWILTNAHVVEEAPTDLVSGAQVVQVNLGHMRDGHMELVNSPIAALVYKKDVGQDLALVKLAALPAGEAALPALALAPASPAVGSECIAIGHPAAGMLWTVRSCEVTNVGVWPEEQIDFVITRLQATSSEDQERLRHLAASMPRRKIVLSSCRINPGDSGGPLVDPNGALIAVTFAIPLSDPSSGVSLDKFAYHIHVDEVRQFLRERPAAPALHVPDSWPPAAFSVVLDLDTNGKPETMIFGMGPNQPATGVMVDADENFLPNLTPEAFAAAGPEAQWDFEYVYHPVPERRTFYDRDDDGVLDCLRVDVDGDGRADIELARTAEAWQRDKSAASELHDAALLPASMQARLARVIAAIQEQETGK